MCERQILGTTDKFLSLLKFFSKILFSIILCIRMNIKIKFDHVILIDTFLCLLISQTAAVSLK